MAIDLTKTPNIQSQSEASLLKAVVNNNPNDYPVGDHGANVHRLAERPTKDNPDVVTQTLIPIDEGGMLGGLSDASLTNILPILSDIRAAIDSQDRARIKRLFVIAFRAGKITSAEGVVLKDKMEATENDPYYTASVMDDSRLSAVLGREAGGISVSELIEVMTNGE